MSLGTPQNTIQCKNPPTGILNFGWRAAAPGLTRSCNSVTQPTGTPAHRAVVSLCIRHGPERHDGAQDEEKRQWSF